MNLGNSQTWTAIEPSLGARAIVTDFFEIIQHSTRLRSRFSAFCFAHVFHFAGCYYNKSPLFEIFLSVSASILSATSASSCISCSDSGEGGHQDEVEMAYSAHLVVAKRS
ncbi:hypothetical protein VOLCADRAFT_94208, partial [Volvox carteri f. nagariensis]